MSAVIERTVTDCAVMIAQCCSSGLLSAVAADHSAEYREFTAAVSASRVDVTVAAAVEGACL